MSESTFVSCLVAGMLLFFMVIVTSFAVVNIHARERQHTERMLYLQVCDGKCEKLP